AEAAADVDFGEPQRAERDAEDRRQDRAVDVDTFRRADQMQLAALRVRRHGDEPARLERGGRLPRVAKALPDDDRRARQSRLGIADTRRDRRDVVALRPGKQPPPPRPPAPSPPPPPGPPLLPTLSH